MEDIVYVFDSFPTFFYVVCYIIAAVHMLTAGVFGCDPDDIEDGPYRNIPFGGLIVIGASLPAAVECWARDEDLPTAFLIFFLIGVAEFVIADLAISAKEMAEGAEAAALQCGYAGSLFAMAGHAVYVHPIWFSDLIGFELPEFVPGVVMMLGFLLLLASAVIETVNDDGNAASCALRGGRMALPVLAYIFMRVFMFGWDDTKPVLFLLLGVLFAASFVCALIHTFRKMFRRRR